MEAAAMAALKWWDWWRCVWMRVSNNDGGAKEEMTSPSNPGSAMLLWGIVARAGVLSLIFLFVLRGKKIMVKNCGTCEVGWVDLDLVTCYVTVVQNCCLSYLACGHRFAVPDVFPFFFFLFFTQKP